MLAVPLRPRRGPIGCACAVIAALAGLVCPAASVAAAPRSYEGPANVDADVSETDIASAAPASADAAAPSDAPAPEAMQVGESPPTAATLADAEPDRPVAAAGVEPDNAAGFGGRDQPLLRHRLIARTLVAGRINPAGALLESTVGYRRQLFARDTPLFRDTYLLLGVHGFLTPALARIGPSVEIQPAAVIQFGARYSVVGTFGTFSQALSYPSATADWAPSTIIRDARNGRSYATLGNLVTVHNVLQGRFGRVGIRSTLCAYWATLRLRQGDRVYYDQAIDMLLPARGWSLVHDFDLVYSFDFGLRLAARNTLTHAFYRQLDFYPGQAVSQPNGPSARVGPAVLYTFYDRPLARFNRPTVLLLLQWWYAHRFRTGADRSAGFPLVAIGFSFDADILPVAPRRARPGAGSLRSARGPKRRFHGAG